VERVKIEFFLMMLLLRCTTSIATRKQNSLLFIPLGMFDDDITTFLQSTSISGSTRSYYKRMKNYDDSPERKQQRIELFQQQRVLQERATKLTLSFYRLVLRSIRTIRYGNDHDEKEFQKREEQQKQREEELFTNITKIDKRLDMISMLPEVDRTDELLSRFNYYTDYARENIHQESDRLPRTTLWNNPEHIERYISLLKRGEQHRVWLLKDMKFPIIPCKTPTKILYEQFKNDAIQHVEKVREFERSE
jgi:hypothetical protein